MISIDYSVEDSVPDLPLKELDEWLQKILSDSVFNSFPNPSKISVVFVHDEKIKEMNSNYRGKNEPTDVLTFVLNEELPDNYLLGEIIISTDTAKLDANELNISQTQEYLWLLTHGFLHLAGYDHHSEKDGSVMKNHEYRILRNSNLCGGIYQYGI
ncbi:MAG: rRNA maturation RNase YbeY [Caldisericia bacterium]|nr:rRNA maturation RNase YbeY [Caldisericia bacterium]